MTTRAKSRTCPPTPTPASAVHVHIERLVLDGLPLDALAAAQFQSGLEAELTRGLAAVPRSAWNSRSLARLSAAPVSFARGTFPTGWGGQAARAVLASVVTETDSAQGVPARKLRHRIRSNDSMEVTGNLLRPTADPGQLRFRGAA